MRFEWDSKTAERNIRKHGVSFDTAMHVFEDENRKEWRSNRDKEVRWVTVGLVMAAFTLSAIATAANRSGSSRPDRQAASRKEDTMAIIRRALDPARPYRMSEEEKLSYDSRGDEDIDFADIPELTDEFLERAGYEPVKRAPKEALSIRLDPDVLEWLRATGPGYQTRINYILRVAMETSKPDAGRSGGRAVKSARKASRAPGTVKKARVKK
jgi:uncharacterized protein (DUF4415 family)